MQTHALTPDCVLFRVHHSAPLFSSNSRALEYYPALPAPFRIVIDFLWACLDDGSKVAISTSHYRPSSYRRSASRVQIYGLTSLFLTTSALLFLMTYSRHF